MNEFNFLIEGDFFSYISARVAGGTTLRVLNKLYTYLFSIYYYFGYINTNYWIIYLVFMLTVSFNSVTKMIAIGLKKNIQFCDLCARVLLPAG